MEVHFDGAPRHEQPTPAELEILKILWQRGEPASVRDVFEIVNDGADPQRAYTSVMSLLNVMTDKGLLRRSPFQRAFLYEPVAPREQTLRSMLGETLERVYNGSASLLVAHLLDQSHPSGEELKQIRSLLDDYQHRGSGTSQEGGIAMQAIAIEAFKSVTAWVWPTMLHSLWIGLLAASIVAIAFQAFTRLSHQARYGILLAGLGVSVFVPVVATLLYDSVARPRAGRRNRPICTWRSSTRTKRPRNRDRLVLKRKGLTRLSGLSPDRLRHSRSTFLFTWAIASGNSGSSPSRSGSWA